MSVSEFAIFSNPTIRNQLKVTLTFTRLFSLLKGFALGKLLLPPSAKEPSGGVRKGRVREGSDEGPYGRSLSVPPDFGGVMLMTQVFLFYKIIFNKKIVLKNFF